MSESPLPPLVISPLTDNRRLIEAVQTTTGEPTETVIQRLIDEETCCGKNVRRDADAAGLKRYVWSQELIDFYRTTKSFVYESAIWNRTPLKMQMREWIGQFVRKHNLVGRRVVTFGDGLGFDAAFMAMLGCQVTYFEPSLECAAFAKSVFEQNGLQVKQVTSPDQVEAGSYDVVVCLDVLEHVPNPPEVVELFSKWLRDGGYLITHSPFFFIEPYHPTHLSSNRRYSGNHAFFRKLGLYPFDAKFFWDPIVLKKSSTPLANQLPLAAKLGGAVLKLGRWTWMAHSLTARLMSRRDAQWREGLLTIQREREGVRI
jgi:SAM-dependent methyltransferase